MAWWYIGLGLSSPPAHPFTQ